MTWKPGSEQDRVVIKEMCPPGVPGPSSMRLAQQTQLELPHGSLRASHRGLWMLLKPGGHLLCCKRDVDEKYR